MHKYLVLFVKINFWINNWFNFFFKQFKNLKEKFLKIQNFKIIIGEKFWLVQFQQKLYKFFIKLNLIKKYLTKY